MNDSIKLSRNYCNILSKYINSSMISDILAEMGSDTTITGYTSNMGSKRVFGKATTMRIRKLESTESADGIYDALESYDYIEDGDIIVVETEVPEKAYFGELNANLAIRHGAIATIVNGKTRDIECVSVLDYPVFSLGYSASDVKGHGTLDSINKKITIGGQTIEPGDYIMADMNGISIIPKEIVVEVIDKALESIEKEMNVKLNVIKGLRAHEIPKHTGNF